MRIFLLVATTLSFSSNIAYADISESMCQGYLPIVEQALSLRGSGLPIDASLSMADSALDLNRSLYRFLRDAIYTAYTDPEWTRTAISNGQLLELCAKTVRGY